MRSRSGTRLAGREWATRRETEDRHTTQSGSGSPEEVRIEAVVFDRSRTLVFPADIHASFLREVHDRLDGQLEGRARLEVPGGVSDRPQTTAALGAVLCV